MVKKVLMIIAEKSEASEVVVPVDILRNTDGIEVTIASVHGKEPVKVSAGIMITPDVSLSDLESLEFDAIILPGGEGHVHLEKSELVGSILRNQYESGKIVATICMGSNVLLAFSIGLGSKITSYPFNNNNAELMDKYEYVLNDVVQDKVSHCD